MYNYLFSGSLREPPRSQRLFFHNNRQGFNRRGRPPTGRQAGKAQRAQGRILLPKEMATATGTLEPLALWNPEHWNI